MPTGALQEFIRRETERIVSACTQCGRCFEACPMTRYSPQLESASSHEVVRGIIGLLRGEPDDPRALAWAAVCVRSGSCVPACPDGVNPKMMVRIARIMASGGLGGTARIPARNDRDYFNRIRAFARLQLTDEEMRDWM